MTVENLGEAAFAVETTVIKSACQTVARHDIGEVWVDQSFDVADVVAWLTPKFLGPMVTMLQDEGTLIDGLVHHVACSVPIGEVRHVVRDITASVGTEVVHHAVGMVIGGPAASRSAFIDGIDADWVLPKLVFHEALDDL